MDQQVSEYMRWITVQNLTVTIFITLAAVVAWIRRSNLSESTPFRIPGGSWISGHFKEIQKHRNSNFCDFAIAKAPPGAPITRFDVFFGSPRYFVNTYEACKSVFMTQANISSERPVDIHRDNFHMGQGVGGLIVGKKGVWESNRKFIMNQFRNLGLGKSDGLERKIIEESRILIDSLSANPNIHPSRIFQRAIANIISAILFGDRFELSDPGFNTALDVIAYGSEFLSPLKSMLRKIHKYLPIFPTVKEQLVYSEKFDKFLIQNMAKQVETFDPNNVRSLIHAYLKEAYEKEPENMTFHLGNMKCFLRELFFAGTETTSSTMLWLLAALSKYPEMQLRLHREIDEVIGSNGKVTIEMINKMNYLQALICETLRFGCIAPNTIAHEASADITVCPVTGKGGSCPYQQKSVTIPNKGVFFGNLWAVSREKSLWNNPEQFNPDRFLKGGKLFKPEYYMPFGLGPRLCVGKKLAETELKIMAASIFQRFRVTCDEKVDLSQRRVGMTSIPAIYTHNFIER